MKFRTKKSIALTVVFIVVWISLELLAGLFRETEWNHTIAALAVMIAAYLLGMGDNWRDEETLQERLNNG